MKMRIVIASVVLLVMVDLTVQKARIGRLCPERDKLEEEFYGMCIGIKCKVQQLVDSNFSIKEGRGIKGLHPQFHNVTTCNHKCPSGFLSVPASSEVDMLMHPNCCVGRKCINISGTLTNLELNGESSNLYEENETDVSFGDLIGHFIKT